MLTDTKLRSLEPKASPFRVADANGLCIEVRPSGAKVWRYRYRYLGKASIVTLDDYPSMSLQAARVERDRLRSLLRGGANPAHREGSGRAGGSAYRVHYCSGSTGRAQEAGTARRSRDRPSRKGPCRPNLPLCHRHRAC
ncbi:Arm DNA-binding domain-containing protein [Xanthomonas indica]|uniref:Arm DNA-binding domain-containing protein n=1 Tax=Xanthomonas indica TaxID=2912242 RepID=A0AAU8I5L8_9XANT|nr:Arm DNA-binding domain-containing protein [Xanthomonas indica]